MQSFKGVDYLLIDTQFNEQELLVRQTARQFVDDRLMPVIRDCFRDARFPTELIPELGRLGFLGANLEGYGCAGMSNVEYGLIMQELERADSGLRSLASSGVVSSVWAITSRPASATIGEARNSWSAAARRSGLTRTR